MWSAGEVGQEHLPSGRRKHVTWALKDRSDVNRTFWEWSPEEDSMLKF